MLKWKGGETPADLDPTERVTLSYWTSEKFVFLTIPWTKCGGIITLSLSVFLFALPNLSYENLKALKVKSKEKLISL
jgi:hypothetical protein